MKKVIKTGQMLLCSIFLFSCDCFDCSTETFIVTPSVLYFDELGVPVGNNDYFNVTSLEVWTATLQSSVSWFNISHVSGGNGLTKVSVTVGPTTIDREAVITITQTSTGLSKTVRIIQTSSTTPGVDAGELDNKKW